MERTFVRARFVMWIGVKTPLHHVSWRAVSHAWQAADRCELLASAWVFDHLSAAWGDPRGSCLEAWTVLAALSSGTTRIGIGTMCSPVALRHPFLLAQMASTVQQVSDGRLSVGLGTGSKDLDGLGLRESSPAAREQQLAEALTVLRRAFSSGARFRHSGQFYDCDMPSGALPTLGHCQTPELIVGGQSDGILRIAAVHADHWNFPKGTPSAFCRARDRLLCHAVAAGRVPPKCSAHLVWETFSPRRLLDELKAWAAVGADGVIVALPAPWPDDAVSRLADVVADLQP
jgi:alkanesulfonate monooxygenase SsuD/methylene tetrahydromethanopterin reductase-like flavin-dependent oxidoreductase (luciferase family)